MFAGDVLKFERIVTRVVQLMMTRGIPVNELPPRRADASPMVVLPVLQKQRMPPRGASAVDQRKQRPPIGTVSAGIAGKIEHSRNDVDVSDELMERCAAL